MSVRFIAVAFAASALSLSCHKPAQKKNLAGSRRPIDQNEDPSGLIANASYKLSDNITADDIGQDFPSDANVIIPYPDTYWPFKASDPYINGTNAKWNGGDKGPLDLYSTLVGQDPSLAATWEGNNHGPNVPGVAAWWGHCPGWTAAAMLNAPLQHAIDVSWDAGSNTASPCTAGAAGCIHFEIGDINALEAEVNVDGDSKFIGARCDTAPKDIQRDSATGHIIHAQNVGCDGVNAGTLLIVLNVLMKQQNRSMAIDAQNDFNTNEIWNQPAYRYHVYDFKPSIDAATAGNWVVNNAATGDQTGYTVNDAAKAWAYADIGVKWVSENGPNVNVVSGADSTRETRRGLVFELDADGGNIIGGEYAGKSTNLFPFIWIATAAGPENLDPNAASGNTHNPYVKPSIVAQLVTLAQAQQ